MAATGDKLLQLAAKHVGEDYVFGALAPKDNGNWKGPWDCAEFTSWLVFQVAGTLYGCIDNGVNPSIANAYSGAWARDGAALGNLISIDEAARTPGAIVVRKPSASVGHVVVSDGTGTTVEAHSTNRGVIREKLANRTWDIGILVPGITYTANATAVVIAPPKVTVLRLADPRMTGTVVRKVQQALKALGLNPGPIDGEYGPLTAAAVQAFQLGKGIVVDGEVGPKTAKSLGVVLV